MRRKGRIRYAVVGQGYISQAAVLPARARAHGRGCQRGQQRHHLHAGQLTGGAAEREWARTTWTVHETLRKVYVVA